MKPLIVLVLAASLGLAAKGPTQISEVQKVYMLPMTSGLDQYLAERLTREGVFAVVVDPAQADAVWTDGVDERFAAALDELYPPAKPEPAKKEGASKADSIEAPPRRTFTRGRGTVFLVGVGSRRVIWSTFLRLEDRSPKGLHKAADEIVKRLKKDLGK